MNKRLVFIYVIGLVFSVINVVDLAFTLTYPSAEINPLVIATFDYYYVIKMGITFVLAVISLNGLINEVIQDERGQDNSG